MTLQRQVSFWIFALALLVLGLWTLRDILLPFIAGLALAYLLDPLADRLERLGLNRLISTLAILSVFLLLFVLAIILLAPIIANQTGAFIEKLPGYVTRLQQLAHQGGEGLFGRIFGEFPQVEKSLGDVVGQGAKWLAGVVQSLWSGGAAVLSVFSLLVVTPVVAFYLLLDFDHMVERIDSWLPVRSRLVVRRLAHEIDVAIAGFVRGQATVCLLLGGFYAIGLGLVGLNFGVLIGLISGFLSFIPYVGSLTGLVLSVGVAVVQFWPDWHWVAVTLAIFAAGQFIEGNILSPKLVGESIGLHPVWLMFALFAFGSLMGFVGMLVAVPLAAAIGVLARYALERYLASPLHTGEPRRISVEPDQSA